MDWNKLWELADGGSDKPAHIEITDDPALVLIVQPDGEQGAWRWKDGRWVPVDPPCVCVDAPCDVAARDDF